MRKYKTLEFWIREALSDNDKEGACTALACVYLKTGGGTREVHSVKLGGKTWQPKDLSDLFTGKAETYAQDMGGIQKFELQAFYGKTEPQATHMFTIVDGEVQADGQGRTIREAPNAEGLTSQAMKHAERAYELATKLAETMAVTSVQQYERWALREEKLQTELNDAYTIVRDMLMKQVSMDHELRIKELAFARSTQERAQFLKMMPALANTVAGKEVFPMAAADTALLDTLAEKVKPEMVEQLSAMGILPPQLAAALTARFNEAIVRRQAEAEALAKLPPANPDPRKDAAGEAPEKAAE